MKFVTRKAKLLGFFLLPPAFFYALYFGRIYPGVKVAGLSLAGKEPQKAALFLEKNFTPPEALTVEIENHDAQTFEITKEGLELSYDFNKTSQRAYGLGHSGNPFFDVRQVLQAALGGKNYSLELNYNTQRLEESLGVIAGQVSIEPVYPSVSLEEGKINVEKGQTGREIDITSLRLAILTALAQNQKEPVRLVAQEIDPTLNEEQEKKLIARAEKLKGKNITLQFEFQDFEFAGEDLFTFLDLNDGFKEEALEKLVNDLAKSIERQAQNPTFVFKNGRVEEFAPAKDGVRIKANELKDAFIKVLESEEVAASLQIPVEKTSPKVATESVNDLGIKELIGRGTSRFRGSISSRVYNINLAATRLNGTLIKPGEVFSFNAALGDVSKLTGYKEAYVIQDGKTVLGDGGGVCQVSTTFFRAALDAGLPIVERRAHSYRVGYYEQDAKAGLDATVYSPTTDLKIKNDTPGHILIQAYPDTKNMTLVFEFYGTNDGREVTLTAPIVSDFAEPPEPLYIDDPNLPAGKTEQIDFAAWGAKSRFYYKVIKEGQTLYEKTFYSNYRAWQAKFLRGTGPAI